MMLNVKKISLPIAIGASLIGAIAIGGAQPVEAAILTGTLDLKTGQYSGKLWQRSDIVSFVNTPVERDGNGYFETVFKLDLDPSKSNYKTALFDIEYDADPSGISVNIGDSRSNDGHDGDAGTQSNDAEMQIGATPDYPVESFNDLLVYGNDYDNTPEPLHVEKDVVSKGTNLSLAVSNNQLAWDNHNGNSNELNSPYLYALNGQPDEEGPINYEIFAAFNNSISGTRLGSGVSNVTISLSTSVPEPSAILGLFAFGSVGAGSFIKRKQKKA